MTHTVIFTITNHKSPFIMILDYLKNHHKTTSHIPKIQFDPLLEERKS